MACYKNLLKSLLIFSLLCSTGLTAPIATPTNDTAEELVKRYPGQNYASAISATFDITGWPNIAEENCYAMLCLENGNRIYQRVGTAGASNAAYRASGASLHPFQQSQLGDRHTQQINSQAGSTSYTDSAEEFPWRSIQLPPNAIRYLFPASQAEQSSQGGQISGMYSHYGIDYNFWFHITFSTSRQADSLLRINFGIWCNALHSTPPNFALCRKPTTETLYGTSGVDIAEYAYQIDKTGKAPYGFEHAAGSHSGQYYP